MKHDVIYVVKNNYDSEELLYSIRSLCKNFPFRKLVIVGGCPDYIEPDICLHDEQTGKTKWSKTMGSLQLALECEDLTEDVWLFNDDFFVMNKLKNPVNLFNGTLENRITTLHKKNPRSSSYIRQLEVLKGQLVSLHKDTLSFALHTPMLINRSKALMLFDKYPKLQMFRSFYGNFYEIECTYSRDVKVYDNTSVPNSDYLSTTDESFRDGTVGGFIRASFPDPCKYEKQNYLQELYTEEGDEIIS